MSDPYIGEIRIFGFDYAPIGWAFCDGGLLPAAQYQALLAVIGTTFGGDGRTTVGVPNLMGKIPVHQGQGGGLSNYPYASSGGSGTVTLTGLQIANHSHAMVTTNSAGTTSTPAGLLPGVHNEPEKGNVYKTSPALDAQFAAAAVGGTGGSQGHENRQPYLPLNFCIAVEGVFPVRS